MRREQLLWWIAIIIAVVGGIYWYTQADDRAYERVQGLRSENACLNFINEYSDSEYMSEVLEIYKGILAEKSLDALNAFAEDYSYTEQGASAKTLLEQKVQELYRTTESADNISGWTHYLDTVPEAYRYDAQERLSALHRREEQQRWGSEPRAWGTATSLHTAEAYERYLTLYPRGGHRAQAEARLVDLAVDKIVSGEHGSLPAMEQTRRSVGSRMAQISVRNSTAYSLTVMYSGPTSKRLVLSPHSSGSLSLVRGNYRIAASVDAAGVRPFAGNEQVEGGSYEVEYYIQTYQY